MLVYRQSSKRPGLSLMARSEKSRSNASRVRQILSLGLWAYTQGLLTTEKLVKAKPSVVQDETDVLQGLSHPNVIKILDFFEVCIASIVCETRLILSISPRTSTT
jgi:hypothetical protein